MKITRIFGILMVIATINIMDACKGEKGDIGPSGANGVGTTGATGATGPKGDPGTSTTTGSNNVIQVTFTKTFVPPSPLQGTQIFVFPTVITTDMLNNSGLIIYVKTSDYPGSWVAVPGAGIANAGVADVLRYTFHADTRDIGIVRESGTSITSITQVRVLIIPAGTMINGRNAAVDYTDYDAVKAYYGLKD